MKKAIVLIGCTTAMIASAAQASYNSSNDSDGCWDALNSNNGKCVRGTTQWNDEAFIATLSNNCSHRVYVRMCNERYGKSPDCGATGIRGGSSTNWRTGRDATGRSAWRTIGSVTPSKDWVCAGKVSGWRNDFGF